MRIIHNNILDLTTIALTASSVLSGFPKSNLIDERLSMVWISDTATTQTVLVTLPEIDLGAGTTYSSINTIAILGHNLLSGTTVKIEANVSDSWASPALSETMVVNENIILKFLSTSQTYKYWRFYFNQASVSIGRLWLSEYLTVDPSSLLDFKVSTFNSDKKIYGKNRQKWAIDGIEWRKIELNFPETDYTMIKSIEDLYDEVGNYKSIIFCNFDTIREYKIVEPLYCSIVGDIGFTHTNRMKMKYNLVLEENR